MSPLRHRWAVSLGLLTLLTVGCATRPEAEQPPAVPAGGKVTVGDRPVPNAMVMFYRGGETEVASATTDEAGQFVLSTYGDGDGVPLGEYKVVVTFEELDSAPPRRPAIPKQFTAVATTPLTATVTEAGPNTFHFKLE
jgi:hypothetical protein